MKSFFLLLMLLISSYAFSADLIIKVEGLKSTKGNVLLALFDSANGFPDDYNKAIENITVKASKNTQAQIKNLESGEYAIAIFHDKNSDSQLNTNILGIPKEGFGFSNNPKIRFGPPKFEKAKVKFSIDKTIIIKLKHL
jgi:uncharacterized protein (DUF2141 family)